MTGLLGGTDVGGKRHAVKEALSLGEMRLQG